MNEKWDQTAVATEAVVAEAEHKEGAEESQEKEKGSEKGKGPGREGQREWEGMEISSRRRRGRRDYRLTGSLAAKIIAFFLLAGSCLAGMGFGILAVYMGVNGYYTEKLNTVISNAARGESREILYDFESLLEQGRIEEAVRLCEGLNIDIDVIQVDDRGRNNEIWSSRDDYDAETDMDIYIPMELCLPFGDWEESVDLNGHIMEAEELYLYRARLNPEFPFDDSFRRIAEMTTQMYEARYMVIGLAAASILLCLICFIFLLCSAGHRNGVQGIVPGALTGIPLDVLTVIFGGGALFFAYILINMTSYMSDISQVIFLALGGTVLLIWLTFYCMDFALRVRLGKCWRYSLIYLVLRGIGRGIRFLGRECIHLIQGIPLIITTVVAYLGLCILEFIGVILYVRESEGVLLWALEKVFLLVVIMYIALVCRKLLEASRALAEGRAESVVDTSRMFGDFREHGENLNSLGQGMARAVAERMKSEHLKTELISNVSHDLKTPLTSIINYADLICEETATPFRKVEMENGSISDREEETIESGGKEGEKIAKIAEYAEVLLRQSRRLKKLLEDLMEASKATTGNLEVNLELCEVGVLLSQAVGEYQQRMEEKELDLIARQPEEPVKIMADGRHLWRVFDNLLNNICKYAQEKSRVYLSVEEAEGRVLIVFRNMSKYALNISPEELEERFVRGDKSRHMEGNGLGLSIAKSLVELQNGRMEIVIDGDLFKVILSFPKAVG